MATGEGSDSLHVSSGEFAGVAEEIFRKGSGIALRARGTSMAPFIHDGDRVFIVPSQGNFSLGDVVLIRTGGGSLLLHRIVGRRGKDVLTRGDAMLSEDGFTAVDTILGKVVRVSGRGSSFHLRMPFRYLFGIKPVIPLLRRLSRFFSRGGRRIP